MRDVCISLTPGKARLVRDLLEDHAAWLEDKLRDGFNSEKLANNFRDDMQECGAIAEELNTLIQAAVNTDTASAEEKL